ncbi:MAG: DUF1264 domain-containing protein [Candidatus Acidiferrales bacterium]
MRKTSVVLVLSCLVLFVVALAGAQEMKKPMEQMPMKKLTPADGHDIHVVAPHVVEGMVMGPYHHYCKAVKPEVLECLIYESTEPNALLVQIEYMIAKSVTRSHVRLDLWNKHYHDHLLEIASGRVQVLDRSPEEAAKIAEAASQTDGIIFHLWWPHGAAAPNGTVKFPQSISHKNRTEAEGGPVDPNAP